MSPGDRIQLSATVIALHAGERPGPAALGRGEESIYLDAQTIYYRLTEHDFIGRLREEYFGAWAK